MAKGKKRQASTVSSSSSSSSDRKKKRKKEKKEKEKKKAKGEKKALKDEGRRKREEPADDRRRDDRRGGGDPGEPREKPPPEKVAKKSWKDELADEEPMDDGSAPELSEDDEEAAERKLAESRKRREAAMMKAREQEKAVFDPASGGPEQGEGESFGNLKSFGPGEGGATPQPTPASSGNDGRKEEEEEEDDTAGGMFDLSADVAKLNAQVRKDPSAMALTGASGEDWDDDEGYYSAQIGEVMDDRYVVVENVCGKGVFSNVVKAKDKLDPNNAIVAIKILRNNDMMKKQAETEVAILELLSKNDPTGVKHIVRLLSTFYFRKHLCLVFECMLDDLRGVVKKQTKGKGLSLEAMRAYTKQLMTGLDHIHKHGYVHADIKPDNILGSKGYQVVKICDLGTAVELKDVMISPYLVSRFYRAPEIILGCEWGMPVDTFAMGCTLYECFTGRILLKGKNNNDMILKIIELKGRIPSKVIKRGQVWKNHFTDTLDFQYMDQDKYTKDEVVRTITDFTVKKSMEDLILERVGTERLKSTTPEDQQYVKKAKQFADLLTLMTSLDPEKRITPAEALNHRFLTDVRKAAPTSGPVGVPVGTSKR